MELADLFPIYPSINDLDFQTQITRKYEFYELHSGSSETLKSRRGEFFRSQKAILRFLIEFDRLLLMWRTGTGKTCAIVAFTEYVKSQMKGEPQRKFIILVKGPTLKQEFKNQLICRCTPPGTYDTEEVNNANLPSSQKALATRLVNKWYRIMTYAKFASTVLKNDYTDEQIKAEFSDKVFFIDEIHNLRNVDERFEQGLSKKLIEKRKESLEDLSTGQSKKSEIKMNVSQIYDVIHRVLRLAERIKVIGASATPIVNEPYEIRTIMNLILPPNNQMPENINFYEAGIEAFIPYFRGHVSYIREMKSDVVVTDMLNTNQPENTFAAAPHYGIYFLRMDGFQEQAYRRATNNKEEFRSAERKASYFVYPPDYLDVSMVANAYKTGNREFFSGGAWGTDGFKRYISKVPQTPDRYVMDIRLKQWITPDYLYLLSAKYYHAVQVCLKEGRNTFIYGEYVRGSGIILLGLILEQFGFEKFEINSSVFQSTEGAKVKPYCSGENTEGRRITIDPYSKTKKYRYCLLTKDTPPARFDTIKELRNSPENKHGEYIKVVLSSRVARDGVNMLNVQDIIILGGEWHESATYQALSRSIRTLSHEDLLEEKRKELFNQGLSEANAKIDVSLYKYASYIPEVTTLTYTSGGEIQESSSGIVSVDLNLYNRAEEKGKKNKRIERFAKQCAFDCHLNKARNVRLGEDKDGTSICDYQKCDYECINPAPNPSDIDYSSYDILYSGEVIYSIIDNIMELFRMNNYYTLEEIKGLLEKNKIREKLLLMALEKAVQEKIPMLNRMGFTCYLSATDNVYFLQSSYMTTNPNFDSSIYDWQVPTLETRNLNDVASGIIKIQGSKYLDQLREKVDSPDFDQLVDSIPLPIRADILEESITKTVTGQSDKLSQKIVQKYDGHIFNANEPRTMIYEMSMKSPEELRIKDITKSDIENFRGDGNTEKVWWHTLYTTESEINAYSSSLKQRRREGRYRLFKISRGKWEDTKPEETKVYNMIVQIILGQRRERFVDNPYYGMIGNDGNFKIVDNSNKKNTGQACTSYKVNQLLDIIYKSGAPYPDGIDESYFSRTTREEMVNYLLMGNIDKIGTDYYGPEYLEKRKQEIRNFSDKDIKFYYSWIAHRGTVRNMCAFLREYFMRRGLVIE